MSHNNNGNGNGGGGNGHNGDGHTTSVTDKKRLVEWVIVDGKQVPDTDKGVVQ